MPNRVVVLQTIEVTVQQLEEITKNDWWVYSRIDHLLWSNIDFRETTGSQGSNRVHHRRFSKGVQACHWLDRRLRCFTYFQRNPWETSQPWSQASLISTCVSNSPNTNNRNTNRYGNSNRYGNHRTQTWQQDQNYSLHHDHRQSREYWYTMDFTYF